MCQAFYMVSLPALSLSAQQALNIGKQSRAGALGLLAYDHFITLGREIEYVWWQDKTRWGFWLYIFNRFLAPLWLIFDTIPLTPSGVVSSKVCIVYLMFDDIIILVTTITVQVILQLRIYVLYERSHKILLLLISLCAMELATMAILVGVTLAHISHLPIISTPTGCEYTGVISLSALFWIPALIYEPILCALVMMRAWKLDRASKHMGGSPVVHMLARDSLIYFVGIFAELLISTVIWARFPTYINIVNPWSAALPSVLGSRLLLNMRKRAYQTETYTGATEGDGYHLSTLNAAPGVMTAETS
ncbi:hypothetical protein JB92DRAFT_2819535 [Gautieria morchelliformis]|nr:hypothetical protein JB92DRAFT_2819535 [Gautieria morchelliformis]